MCSEHDLGGNLRRTHRQSLARIVAGVLLGVGLAGGVPFSRGAEPAGPAKNEPQAVASPLSAADALARFRLEPGLAIDLVAAEPLVVAPCALAFDSRSRLFVVENRGYPSGSPAGSPLGRIALLDDSDSDGRYDRRREFADGLTFPNGILPWSDGLLVTCAPDVLFLRDRDGDGRADERKVLLTGFSTAGSTQLRVSHPTLAVDNWVYLTSGLTGGNVTSPDLPDHAPVELKRTDLRVQLELDPSGLPRVVRFEACDGGAQFGMSFDEWGRRFICYNRVQVQHVVLSSATLRRNPNLAFAETVQNCPADMAPEPVRGHGAAARLFPLSQNVTTADSHAGTFTAACGVTVWRGSGLPAEYRGGAFSCDPTANVVHFDRLDPDGVTFAARRVRDGVEFLASPDNWFRPVFLAPGPDGCLYLCDMYRKTIEHPDYLPVEIRKHTDFESGRTMGRIWRVRRESLDARHLLPAQPPQLAQLDATGLVQQLEQPDGWRRDTAQRLLVERREPTATESLRQLIARNDASPAAVVAALRLLATFATLDDARLLPALAHAQAGVREHAVQLAAERLTADRTWLTRLVPLAADADARVRMQVAIALGGVRDEQIVRPLAAIALRDAPDRWTRAAVFSSVAGFESQLLDALLTLDALATKPPGESSGTLELCYELGRLLGAARPSPDTPAAVAEVTGRIVGSGKATDEQRTALLTGFVESLRARGVGRDEAGPLAAATGAGLPQGDQRVRHVQALVDRARLTAADESLPAERRQTALGLLAQTDYAQAGSTLLQLVEPHQPAGVQSAAVRALGLMRDERIAPALLSAERFPLYTPRLRDDVVSTLIANPQHLPGVLAAVEAGIVPRGAIDSLRRGQLTEHRDPAIRDRARKLFDPAAAGDRGKVYAQFKDVVALPAHPANGQVVFKRTCAQCHRLDREGVPVGPDLFGMRNQPKEAILLHILIPEHEITPGFGAYVVSTVDGRVLTGLIAGETPTSITLRQAQGKEETILRKDIEELAASRLSLMPQELEKTHTRQELADLLAYLKGEKP